MRLLVDIHRSADVLRISNEEGPVFKYLTTDAGERLTDGEGNYLITDIAYVYRGDIIGDVSFHSSLPDKCFGISQYDDVVLELTNEDNGVDDTWDEIAAEEELRGCYVVITRGEDSKHLLTGVITDYTLGLESSITVTPKHEELEQLLPLEVVTADTFSETALDIGAPIPICFGWCKNVPLPNITNDRDNDYYDYLIGHGTVESLWIDHANDRGIKRNGVLVNESEYTFYDGSQVAPYPGYSFIRFTKEQLGFSSERLYITADIKGLELGGASAERNPATQIKNVLSNTTWGLSQSVNTTSFTTAATTLTDWHFDFAIYDQQQARDIINEMLFSCHSWIYKNNDNEWCISVDAVDDGYIDDLLAATGTTTQDNMKISAVDGTALVDTDDATFASDLTNNTGKYIIITDSAGNQIEGWIKAAGDGEDLGAGLVSNGEDFTDGPPPTGWTAVDATLAGIAGGEEGNCLEITRTGGTTQRAYQEMAGATAGMLLKGSAYVKSGTSGNETSMLVLRDSNDSLLNYKSQTSTGDWEALTHPYATVPVGETGRVEVAKVSATDGTMLFDSIGVRQVTGPSINGVTIASTRGGTTYNWAAKDSDFDYNDASGYTYNIYEANRTFGENDGYYDNCEILECGVTPSRDVIKTAYLNYDSGTYQISLACHTGFGADKTFETKCIYENATADKLLSYLYGRDYYADKKLRIQTGTEGDDLVLGEVITVNSSKRSLASAEYRITAITEEGINYIFDCEAYDDNIFAAQAIGDPTAIDVGTPSSYNLGDGSFKGQVIIDPDGNICTNVNALDGAAGIIINDAGIYAGTAVQTTVNANVRILATGDAYFIGVITSTSGAIGGWVIIEKALYHLDSGTPTASPSNGITLETEGGTNSKPVLKVYDGATLNAALGNYADGKYGIYAIEGSIGGWSIASGTLANGTDIILDATNKKISIKDATFGNAGIQLDYNAGTPRMYAGNGSDKFFKFDGADTLGNFSGIVNMASQGGCNLKKTSNQTISTGSYTVVDWDAEDWDTLNEFDLPNNKYTMDSDGKIMITCQLMAVSSVNWTCGEEWDIAIYVNGGFTKITGNMLVVDTGCGPTIVSQIAVALNLEEDDYVQIKVYQTSGEDKLVWGSAYYTYACFQKLA